MAARPQYMGNPRNQFHSGLNVTGFGAQSLALVGGGGGNIVPILVALSSGVIANGIAYSLDGGVTWAQGTVSINAAWQGVAFSPSLGYAIAVSSDGQVVQSVDGITWTTVVDDLNNSNWRRLVWSPEFGVFVIIAQGGVAGSRCATSPDGVSWTMRTTPVTGTTTYQQIIRTASGRLLAGGNVGSTQPIIFSDDGGVSWSQIPAIASQGLQSNFVIAPDGTGRIYAPSSMPAAQCDFYSDDDGSTWTQTPDIIPPTTGAGTGSATDGTTIIRGDPSNLFSAALNGASPGTPILNPYVLVSTDNCGDMLYCESFGVYVGIGGAGSLQKLTSPDGVTWTLAATGIAVGTWVCIRELFIP